MAIQQIDRGTAGNPNDRFKIGTALDTAQANDDYLDSVNTVADLALLSLSVGDVKRTKGCLSIGDGGHGQFIVTAASGTPDGYSRVLLANGNHAVLQGDFNVLQFGGASTAAIQRAIDAVHALGGGNVLVPLATYTLVASNLSETYDNFGVAVPASDCSIILRAGVHLAGEEGARPVFTSENAGLILVAPIAPIDSGLHNIEIDGGWSPGDPGAGHGVFVLGTEGGADISCVGFIVENVKVSNVASYGVALQNGSPKNCSIINVEVENTGADGIDLKARSDVSTEPTGNICENIRVKNHNLRVDGSAGIDVRGIWQLKNVTVTEFGGDPAKTYVGVRFRTKPPVTDAYNLAAARSTLNGFYIRPAAGTTGLVIDGIQSGSDDVHISNGTIVSAKIGVRLFGNVNGSATRNHIVNVGCLDSTEYGMKFETGVTYTTVTNCSTKGSTTAGYRNEAQYTTYVNCTATDTTTISTSGGAGPTQVTVACNFSADGNISIYQVTSGRVAMEAKGSSTDIDIAMLPKGAGRMRFGTYTASADAPVSGYIEIKDTSGVVRKLAIIS